MADYAETRERPDATADRHRAGTRGQVRAQAASALSSETISTMSDMILFSSKSLGV